MARLYRELGAVHDAGFPIFNGSALQLVFFDDLDEAFFVQGARAPALRRSLRRLERVRERLAAARDAFRADPLSWSELAWAADATLHAARKGLAGQELLAWRRRPARLDARARRRLARELSGLAAEQVSLGQELRRLWLRRSRPSDFALTKRRLERSVRSLGRTARSLERNRPAPPPPEHAGYAPGPVSRALYRSLAP